MMVLVPSPYRVACWKFFMLEVYTEICFLAAHKVKFRSMLVYAYTRAHARARVHTHTRTHTHTRAHAHTHARMHSCTTTHRHTIQLLVDSFLDCRVSGEGFALCHHRSITTLPQAQQRLFICLFSECESTQDYKETDKEARNKNIITIIIIINRLIKRVVGARQMISQPVFSIVLCSPLPSGIWRTPGACPFII